MVRKVCSRVRQDSPGRVDLSELILWVATIGMHLGWRDKLKNFSSPVGSLSPTVAKCWLFVAEEKDLAEILFRVGFDLRDAIQDSTLEIELHHYAQGLGKLQGSSRWESSAYIRPRSR